MKDKLSIFSRELLESLDDTQRINVFSDMESVLTDLIAPHKNDWEQYWDKVNLMIEELKKQVMTYGAMISMVKGVIYGVGTICSLI